jgi:hypothetical protein
LVGLTASGLSNQKFSFSKKNDGRCENKIK